MRILIEGKKTLYGVINEKTLSKEQLLLGATETFMLNEGNYVSLWCQNPEIDLYSIAGHYQGDFFWIQYTYLTHARKLYKKVQTIIKRQKKTIEDILNLMNATIFIKKSPELNQILFQTSNIDEVRQYLSENQSNDLFIRIEDNQYVDVFSRKILKSTKYYQIIRL